MRCNSCNRAATAAATEQQQSIGGLRTTEARELKERDRERTTEARELKERDRERTTEARELKESDRFTDV